MNLNSHYISNRVLKLNVGFLLGSRAGATRDHVFDVPRLRVADDLTVEFLRGGLELTRTRRGILVRGNLRTATIVECVRCLEPFPLQISLDLEELYVFPPTPKAELTVGEDGILDLAPLLRAEVILHIPIKALCKPDCKGLCPECGQNLNLATCTCRSDRIDPRMEALKILLEK